MRHSLRAHEYTHLKKGVPKVKSMIRKRIAVSCIMSILQELISAIFERLHTHIDEYQVNLANVWHIVEHSTAIG